MSQRHGATAEVRATAAEVHATAAEHACMYLYVWLVRRGMVYCGVHSYFLLHSSSHFFWVFPHNLHFSIVSMCLHIVSTCLHIVSMCLQSIPLMYSTQYPSYVSNYCNYHTPKKCINHDIKHTLSESNTHMDTIHYTRTYTRCLHVPSSSCAVADVVVITFPPPVSSSSTTASSSPLCVPLVSIAAAHDPSCFVASSLVAVVAPSLAAVVVFSLAAVNAGAAAAVVDIDVSAVMSCCSACACASARRILFASSSTRSIKSAAGTSALVAVWVRSTYLGV